MTIINQDTGKRNIPQLFLPFDLNSTIPIITNKIPSSKDEIAPYEKSFVINPYTEITTTIKASITLIIFNSVPPQMMTELSLVLFQMLSIF